MKILAIVPARGGSKGIKNKNIVLLAEKPLISWTLKECKKILDSRKYDIDFIVSTDSKEILDVACKEGFYNDQLRPANLSSDAALTLDVLKYELLKKEEIIKSKYDYVLLLQPTCPLRRSKHIEDCIDLMFKNDVDSVVSVKNVAISGDHPFRMKKIENNMLVNFIEQGFEDMRPRQELPDVFLRNGCVYLTRACLIREGKTVVGKKCLPYIMDEESSTNIDTHADLFVAEFYLNQLVNQV